MGGKGKRLLGRPKHAWEDNIKMDHEDVIMWMWTEFMWFRTV
jgi:hypothetical protein